MTTRTISIRVSDEAARTYEAASDDERRKLDALLTIQLARACQPGRPLDGVKEEMSFTVEERGLTPTIVGESIDSEY